MGCDKNNKCTKNGQRIGNLGGANSCKTDADCVPVPEHFWGDFIWKATGEMEKFDAHSVLDVSELDEFADS